LLHDPKDDPAEPGRSDPEASAREARLAYVSDSEPGLRRVKAGRVFGYRDADGGRVEDPKALERIRALAIPPAWTDVWIAPAAKGHIQATGRDVRGRKQYRYHERWSALRDDAKYSSLVAFAEALPKLRERIAHDLRRRDLSRDRVLASIIWLLDNTMIRIGNATYARDNKSFGLTTLRQRHVEIVGSRVRLPSRANPASSGSSTWSTAASCARCGKRRNCPASNCSNTSTKIANGTP
jgi:DNA topoisomerase-1